MRAAAADGAHLDGSRQPAQGVVLAGPYDGRHHLGGAAGGEPARRQALGFAPAPAHPGADVLVLAQALPGTGALQYLAANAGRSVYLNMGTPPRAGSALVMTIRASGLSRLVLSSPTVSS